VADHTHQTAATQFVDGAGVRSLIVALQRIKVFR
jgi:hypothetical protein